MREKNDHSVVIGKEIRFAINFDEKRGKVIDVDNDGGLVIQEGDNIRKLTCGEISIRSAENEWI